MSGDSDIGAAWRAVAELTAPGARLFAGLARAETLPERLEPNLLLLGLDIFGAITAPVRGAPAGERAAGGRTAPTVASAGAAPRRHDEPSALAAAVKEASSLVLPVGRGTPRGGAPAASSESGAGGGLRIRELLYGGKPAAGAPGPGGEPNALATVLGRIASAGAAAAAAPSPLEALHQATLRAVGTVPAPVSETTPASALALLSRLTESILARAVEAGAQARAPSGASPSRPAEPVSGSFADFLQESFGSLGDAPLGVEQAAGERRLRDEPATDAASGTAGAGAPTAAQPSTDGAAAAAVPAAGERAADPAAVAELVNEALVEQARRHGLELG